MRESLVEEAVAAEYDKSELAVRRANMLLGDIGETLRLAAEDRLSESQMRLFHPIGFMLAAENVSDRLESAGVDTQIFAGGKPHERPIGPYGDWAANAHPRIGRLLPGLCPCLSSPPALGFTARN